MISDNLLNEISLGCCKNRFESYRLEKVQLSDANLRENMSNDTDKIGQRDRTEHDERPFLRRKLTG